MRKLILAAALAAALAAPAIGRAATVIPNNGSTTVTLGGTFQVVATANSKRRFCLIENPTTATEALFVYFKNVAGDAATTGKSVSLGAGQSVNCRVDDGSVIGSEISVTATTTSHAFVELDQ